MNELMERNMLLARRGFDIWNVTRDLAEASEFHSEDVADYDNGIIVFKGLATMVAWAKSFADAIPASASHLPEYGSAQRPSVPGDNARGLDFALGRRVPGRD